MCRGTLGSRNTTTGDANSAWVADDATRAAAPKRCPAASRRLPVGWWREMRVVDLGELPMLLGAIAVIARPAA